MKNRKITKEEGSIMSCFGYKISADRRQYIMDGPTFTTYHRTLSDCFEYIREAEIRLSLIGSKELKEVIERLKIFDEKFEKLLAPLKKIEKY